MRRADACSRLCIPLLFSPLGSGLNGVPDNNNGAIVCDGTTLSVSYTHLDVYKRQAYYDDGFWWYYIIVMNNQNSAANSSAWSTSSAGRVSLPAGGTW